MTEADNRPRRVRFETARIDWQGSCPRKTGRIPAEPVHHQDPQHHPNLRIDLLARIRVFIAHVQVCHSDGAADLFRAYPPTASR